MICDEAHFFTSDAMFNPHTDVILSNIIRLFRDAVRVYMSATPYDCIKYIEKYERSYRADDKDAKPYIQMAFYHFQRDYTYLDIKTYSKIDELYKLVADSVSQRREKWLIFIDDKKACQRVKEDLEACDKVLADRKIFAVDATSKTQPEYQQMVLNEKLSNDIFVLITTSVLDNGVNFRGIHNVVVADVSKAKVLQMVGRARTSGSEDKKTLYLKRPDIADVKKRLQQFDDQKAAYHSYELAYEPLNNPTDSRGLSEYVFLNKYYNGAAKDWEDAKHWFGRPEVEPTKLYLNKIAKSLLKKLNSQYSSIADALQKESECGKIGQLHLERQLSWFGKTYCEDDDISFADKEKAKKEFIAFLASYAESGTQIDKAQQDNEFRPKFTTLFDAAFGRIDQNKNRIYSISRMNTYLEDQNIEYVVTIHQKYWTVDPKDWEQNIEE